MQKYFTVLVLGKRSPVPPVTGTRDFEMNRGRNAGRNRFSGRGEFGHRRHNSIRERSEDYLKSVLNCDAGIIRSQGQRSQGRGRSGQTGRRGEVEESRNDTPSLRLSSPSKIDPGEFIVLSSFRLSTDRSEKSLSLSPDSRPRSRSTSRKRSKSPEKRRSGSHKRNRTRSPERQKRSSPPRGRSKSPRWRQRSKSPQRRSREGRTESFKSCEFFKAPFA